jgi:ribosomal-protein-alanine N-acetyltransferase
VAVTVVEPATEADLPALVPVRLVSLPERAPRLLEYAVSGPPLVLVARERPGSTPVGYALTVVGDDRATVLELAVAPAERGHGHGSALVEATVDRLPSPVAVLEVETPADGDAKGFYRRLGFETAERLPDRYEAGDGLLLCRRLRG